MADEVDGFTVTCGPTMSREEFRAAVDEGVAHATARQKHPGYMAPLQAYPYSPYKLDPEREHVGQVPHRCPVCEGRGTVAAGFYQPGAEKVSSSRDQCRSCSGKGVLWA